MFEINYQIVHSDYDDFVGQNGFFQIKCNEHDYGELYSKELESIMDTVSLYDWFERLLRVIKILSVNGYVVLSDVESYNTWIEFQKKNEEVTIGLLWAEKQNLHDVELKLNGAVAGKWVNQTISYDQFRKEVINKIGTYIKYIVEMLDKFKSDMGDKLKIANENGASYELFSNTPIPEMIKKWLTKKGIPFTEFLE